LDAVSLELLKLMVGPVERIWHITQSKPDSGLGWSYVSGKRLWCSIFARERLVFKAQRLVYLSTLGLRVIKKERRRNPKLESGKQVWDAVSLELLKRMADPVERSTLTPSLYTLHLTPYTLNPKP